MPRMAFAFRVLSHTGNLLGNYWLGHLDRSYLLAPRQRVPLHDGAAWCCACCAFVAAERLMSLDEIDAELKRAKSDAAAFQPEPTQATDGTPGPSVDPHERARAHRREEVENWERLRDWRLTRVSPRKCLQCGSTIVRLLGHARRHRHPITDEPIEIELACHMSMTIHELYTPEGDAIPD